MLVTRITGGASSSGSGWRDPILFVSIAVLLLIALLYLFAKTVLIIFFVTILLVVLLDPMVQRLAARRLPLTVAVSLTLLGLLGVMLVVIALAAQSVLPDLAKFIGDFPKMIAQLDADVLLASLPPELANYGRGLLQDAANMAVQMVKEGVLPVVRAFSGVAEMIAVPFLTFYLLKDGRRLKDELYAFLPVPVLQRIAPFVADVTVVLGSYIRGQLLIALFSGTVVWVAASLFGLPYGSILALVSFLSEFVPVIGTVAATVPGVLAAIMQSPAMAVKVLIFYIVLLNINHNIIYPKVVGQAIKVHPVFIMAAILLFGHLFGVIGMLFAAPAVAVGRVWLLHLLGKVDQ